MVLINTHLFTRVQKVRVETEERREIVVHQERLGCMEPLVSQEWLVPRDLMEPRDNEDLL